MRRRVRYPARPAVLLFLLAAVLSARLSDGFTTSDLGRSVDHPAQYLEGGIYASTDSVKRQLFGGGRRLWMPQMDGPFQSSSSRLKCPSVATAFADGGGFLQLCLLLLFCAAVLCASISISPWYKSESFLLRKTIVALSAGAALVTEKIAGKHIIQQGHAETHHIDNRKTSNAVQNGAKGKAVNQTQQARPSSKKSAKKKKGKYGNNIPHSPAPSPRLLEKTLSVSSGDAGSMLSGDTDVDTAPISKEEPVYHCPADVQIARLEAEAARQQELRAAKSKKLATKQAEVQAEVCSSLKTVDKVEPKAGVEDRQGQIDDGSKGGKGASGMAEAKPESHMGNSEDRRKGSHLRDQSVGLDTRPGKRERACKHAPPQRRPEGFSREPLTKRLDKPPSSRQSQVLVVPRKLAGKPRNLQTRERELSDEDRDLSGGAPATPDRSTSSTASSFSSPHSSIYSPHHLSRPYAQVARGDLPSMAVQPPPPPPPRISKFPPGAVYAREFVPASLCRLSSAADSSSSQSSFAFNSQALPCPVNASMDSLSPTSSQAVPTSSPAPSPFPGMSLHRRVPSPSPQGTQHEYEASVGTGYVFDSLKKGLGFPGVFDTIWSSSAAGGWTLIDQQNQPLSLGSGAAPRSPGQCELEA